MKPILMYEKKTLGFIEHTSQENLVVAIERIGQSLYRKTVVENVDCLYVHMKRRLSYHSRVR